MDGESGESSGSALGADRVARSEKFEPALGIGAGDAVEHGGAGRTYGCATGAGGNRPSMAVIRERTFPAGSLEARTPDAGTAGAFEPADAGSGIGDPARLRSGRSVADAVELTTGRRHHQRIFFQFSS